MARRVASGNQKASETMSETKNDEMIKLKTTDRGTETDRGDWLSASPIPRGMTHAVVVERPDGGYLIDGFARSKATAERRLRKANRRVTNPMAAEYELAEVDDAE